MTRSEVLERSRVRGGLFLVAACAAVFALLPASAAGGTGGGGHVYWGAWIGRQLTGEEAPWDRGAVARFESLVGKRMSLVHFASPFAHCAPTCRFYSFPTTPMTAIRAHGSIPFFSWSSASTPVSRSEPRFQLRDVANGDYDGYVRQFASAARRWGHPFFLRFDWEMNGHWFPWGVLANGNSAADYVAAWRHVHDVFRAVGADNASWVWCPNVSSRGSYAPLRDLYPGDDYVDWTCLDGYNWGEHPSRPAGWTPFASMFAADYGLITGTIAPSKPMIVGEIASTEDGGSKAAWIDDVLSTQLPQNFPRIRGIVWMEKYDSGFDWPIETSQASLSAFAAAIRTPFYAGNEFASLGGDKIAPRG
jgi:Glycosyl hydrolase family 26